jgi:hypothetical protein
MGVAQNAPSLFNLEKVAFGPKWASPFSDIGFVAARPRAMLQEKHRGLRPFGGLRSTLALHWAA